VTEQEIQAVVAPSGDIQGALADVHVDLRRLSIGNSPDILTGGLPESGAGLANRLPPERVLLSTTAASAARRSG